MLSVEEKTSKLKNTNNILSKTRINWCVCRSIIWTRMLTWFAFLPIYKHKLNLKLYRTRTYFSLTKLKIERLNLKKSTSASIFWGNYFAFCGVPLLSKFGFWSKRCINYPQKGSGPGVRICVLSSILYDQSLDSLLHQVIFDFWYNGKNWWLYLFWREGFLSTSSGSWW